jgi:hypothetical protein
MLQVAGASGGCPDTRHLTPIFIAALRPKTTKKPFNPFKIQGY